MTKEDMRLHLELREQVLGLAEAQVGTMKMFIALYESGQRFSSLRERLDGIQDEPEAAAVRTEVNEFEQDYRKRMSDTMKRMQDCLALMESTLDQDRAGLEQLKADLDGR